MNYYDAGWFVVCVLLSVIVRAVLFNVCALFVNVISGVVWFACLHCCLCLCVIVV